MAKLLNRQIGRFRKRVADEADVGLLISEVNYLTTFLDSLLEHIQNYRKSWSDILTHQVAISSTYLEVYRDIPGSLQPTTPTPIETLDRLEHFHKAEEELRDELQRDLGFLDTGILEVVKEAKGALKGVHKWIQRRENKKLDWEKYAKHVEIYKKKTGRSKREDQILAKGELDLEGATMAFQACDDHLREHIPPLLEAYSTLLPLLLDTLFAAQTTFTACAYTTISASAASYAITLESEIVNEWEQHFMQYKDYIERELVTIRTGNTVRIPMNQMTRDISFVSKLTGKVGGGGGGVVGGGKKAPPPPPAGPPKGGVLSGGSRPGPGRHIAASSKREEEDDEGYESPPSAPPPVPIAARPSLASSASTNSLSASEAAYRARTAGGRPVLPSHASDASWIQPASVAVDIATRPGFSGGRQSSASAITSTATIPTRSSKPSLHRPSSTLSAPPVSSPTPSPISSIGSAAAAAAAKKKPPPPPPTKKKPPPAPPQAEILTALYDFAGENEGDLSFRQGDRIKVVKKTGSLEDWWVGVVVGADGRERGREGSFPRNYME